MTSSYWVIDFAALALACLLSMLMTAIFACELYEWRRRRR